MLRRVFMTGAAAMAVAVGASGALPTPALAQDSEEVNIYSARHYPTDDQLYEGFTEKTGIRVNRIEGDGDELMQRIISEGRNSPADVFVTVDAGRLWRAEEHGIFGPLTSDTIDERIPAKLRHPDDLWISFTKRARIIFYNPDLVEGPPQTYADLADPKYRDMICIRSSSNVYNLSLMASLIDRIGEEAAQEWAEGVVANFARPPQGNDTAQIRATAAGECGIAVANSYYFARLMASDDPADRQAVEAVEVVFPDQDTHGAHVNVSGAGMVATAPHPDAAKAFLEYLTTDEAQHLLASGNNEYPVVEGVPLTDALKELGEFKEDDINVSVLGSNQPAAQMVYDRGGWK